MRINELLVESQQLDEGPFTQAVGKVGGKIAKGIANVGKDLKTGFKAGYSGEQPPADAAATTAPAATAPVKKAAPTQAAPVQKAAGGGVIDQLKKGFAQGGGEPAADTTTAAPAANPEAEKQSKIGVGQINKIIPTLRTRDLMSLQANLEKTIASKKKAAPTADAQAAAPAATTPRDPSTSAIRTAAGDANPFGFNEKTGKPFKDQAERDSYYASAGKVDPRVTRAAQAAAPAADPAAATTTAPAAPGSAAAKDELYGAGNRPKGAKDKVAALKSNNKKKAAAPTQAEIDAERDQLMGVTSDSIIRKGPVMAESFSLYRKR